MTGDLTSVIALTAHLGKKTNPKLACLIQCPENQTSDLPSSLSRAKMFTSCDERVLSQADPVHCGPVESLAQTSNETRTYNPSPKMQVPCSAPNSCSHTHLQNPDLVEK